MNSRSRITVLVTLLGLLAVLCFVPGGVLAQTTWRVPADVATIQAAIAAASSGDTVLLTEALYTGLGNRDVDFMGKAVTVRSESGDPGQCVIDCEHAGRGFVFDSGEGGGSRLMGLTITNGVAPATGYGGAVHILGSSPEITYCRFVGNSASSSGGGIYCSNSFATISNCVFDSNTADGGGGMSCTRSSAPSAPTITNCLFRGNVADFAGGFEARNLSTPVLEYCTFSDNTANGGGGGIGSDNAAFVMRFCTLSGNSAGIFGGAGIVGSFPAGTTVENTLIVDSPAGDAVNFWDDDFITLTCCNVFGNAGGDWTGVIADQYPGGGNLAVDPQLCSSQPDTDGSWILQEDSPCTETNSACGQIGAWGAECGTVPTEEKSWSGLRSQFR